MPLDLAALLVEAGAVAADDMQRALDRHRELGGSLDTALLELGLVAQDELVRFLSRTSGLPPAPEDFIPVDEQARAVLPVRVAERHRLAPLRLDDGELSLLAAHPVDLTALDEISFMLSLHLVPHAAPEWRVRDLSSRAYGTSLAPRFAALAARLGDPGELLPGPDGREAGDAERPEGAAREGAAGVDAMLAPGVDPRALSQTWQLGYADPPEPLASAVARTVGALDVSALLRDVIGPEPVPPAPPGWSRADAFAALDAARDRDEVLTVVLRHARDFVEAAAVLGLGRGDDAFGVDAVGWPDARDRCRDLRLPGHRASLLRAVLATRGPYLGPVAREPGNQELLGALGRPWPAAALAYPVVLRDRIVCLVYADNGDAPISPARVGDLLLVLGAVGHALERVLLDLKRSRAVPPPAVRDAAGWDLREGARLDAPDHPALDGDDAYQLAAASEALSPSRLEAAGAGGAGAPPDGEP